MPVIKVKRKNSLDSDFEIPTKNKKKIKKSKTIPKWTNSEYSSLISLVKLHGENWDIISAKILNKTAKQCMQKFKNSQRSAKKGNWTEKEDTILLTWVDQHGATKWTECSKLIQGRCGKQCRERWVNILNPDVKKGNWTLEEQEIIFNHLQVYFTSWSVISKALEGRTENSIKNYFYSSIRRLTSSPLIDLIKDIYLNKTKILQNIKQEKKQLDDQFKHFNHLTKQISQFIFSPQSENSQFLQFLLENILNKKNKKRGDHLRIDLDQKSFYKDNEFNTSIYVPMENNIVQKTPLNTHPYQITSTSHRLNEVLQRCVLQAPNQEIIEAIYLLENQLKDNNFKKIEYQKKIKIQVPYCFGCVSNNCENHNRKKHINKQLINNYYFFQFIFLNIIFLNIHFEFIIKMSKKLYFIFFLITTIFCANYKEEFDKRCTPEIIADLETDGSKRDELRAKYNVSIGYTIDDFSKIINGDYGGIVKGGALSLFVFAIILLIYCLIIFFVFLGNLCCCKKVESSEKKANIYLIINLVLLILFVVFIICSLAYSIKLNSSQDLMKCEMAKLPHYILNGVNTKTNYFIGMNPLLDLLTKLSDEISNISSIQSNFQNIQNLNLPQVTSDAIQRANDYETTFKSNTISSGQGSQVVPLVGGTTLTEAMNGVREEFKIYDDVGKKIHEGAQEGAKLSNSSEQQQFVDQINSLKTQITQLQTDFTSNYDGVFDGIESYENGQKSANIAIIAGICFLIVSVLFIMIILFCQIKKQKFFGLNCCIKFFIILLAFLAIIFSILVIVFILTAVVQDSMCNVFESLLSAVKPSSELARLNLGIDSTTASMIDSAIGINGTGELNTVIEIDFSEVEKLLDGLSSFQSFQKEFDSQGNESKSIVPINEEYQKVLDGRQINSNEINSALSTLNQGCESTDKIVLNEQDCNGVAICKNIKDMPSYNQPTCATGSNLNQVFANAKSYSVDNTNLMTQMISQLYGTDAGSLNSKFTKIRNDFQVGFNEFAAVQTTLKNTLDILKTFTEDFSKITNFKILRTELLSLEASFCFDFNQSAYYLSIFFLIAIWTFILLLTCNCCLMRYQDLDQQKSGMDFYDEKDDQYAKDEVQMDNQMEDVEKVPMNQQI